VIFMAGGSGLSSPRSMILDLLEKAARCRSRWSTAQRTATSCTTTTSSLALAAKHPTSPTCRRCRRAGRQRLAGFRGFVHDAAKAHFDNDFRGHKAYLCGPPVMIDACITTLMQGRLFERDIYTEKFFSAADAQQVRSPLFRRSESLTREQVSEDARTRTGFWRCICLRRSDLRLRVIGGRLHKTGTGRGTHS
jgi:phenol hydroxylase P5 protein